MEPRQHTPEMNMPRVAQEMPPSIETGQFPQGGMERLPVSPENSQERRPSVQEMSQQVSSAMPATLPAPIAQNPATIPAMPSSQDDTPLVAADEDLIEKEWVDKAKKIISETQDDPYAREQGIKKLKIEYVRKRYGKDIGEATDLYA